MAAARIVVGRLFFFLVVSLCVVVMGHLDGLRADARPTIHDSAATHCAVNPDERLPIV
jgi:hypothetical protein